MLAGIHRGAVLAGIHRGAVLAGIHRGAVLAGKVFLVVAPDPRAREAMRVTGLDRTLLVFPTVADFRAWNGGSGTQPAGGGALTCR